MKNESPILTFFDALQDGGGAEVVTAAAAEGDLLTANNVWMMLATALVFIMHLGFAGVESGFGQAKNTVNILFKNTITPKVKNIKPSLRLTLVRTRPPSLLLRGVITATTAL